MSSLRAYSDLNASLCTIPLFLFRFRDAHIHKYSNDFEATRLRWKENAKRRKTFKIREKLKKNYHVQQWNISMTFAKKLLFCLPSLAFFFMNMASTILARQRAARLTCVVIYTSFGRFSLILVVLSCYHTRGYLVALCPRQTAARLPSTILLNTEDSQRWYYHIT